MRRLIVDITIMVAAAIVLAIGGYQVGYNSGVEKTRQAAIDSGMANWTIDPKTGNKQFEFKGIHNDPSKIQNP